MAQMDNVEPSAATRAEAYVARVEAALSDLPPEQRSRLTHDLAAHLTEPADSGVPLIDELGTPQEYAAELRSTLPTITPAPAPTPAPAGTKRSTVIILLAVGAGLLAVLVWVVLLVAFGLSPTGYETRPQPAATSAPASVTPAVPAPNLVGLTEQDAVSQLNSAGLHLGTVTTASSATVPKGVVMAMAPAAGSQVPTGTTVDLTVSNGPAS
jgi:hypothetical protein